MRSIRYDLLLRTLRDLSVCLCVSVCLLGTTMSCAKTDEPIEMPFGVRTQMGPKNHVLGGGHCKVWGICGVRLILSTLFSRWQQQCGFRLPVYCSSLPLRLEITADLSPQYKSPRSAPLCHGVWLVKALGECFRIVVAGRNSSSLCRLCVCSPRTAVVAS